MPEPTYSAPGPLFRAADHHNELMDLASRHDFIHPPVDHTAPGDPYAEYRNADDGYDPADDDDDDDDDEEGDDRDFDDRDEAAIDNLYEGDAFQRRLEASWAADDAPAEDPVTLDHLTNMLQISNNQVFTSLNSILKHMTDSLAAHTQSPDYLDTLCSADRASLDRYQRERRARDVMFDAILKAMGSLK